MSLDSSISGLATAVGTDVKSIKTLINGNTADLSTLTTIDKTNLVAAVNELRSTSARYNSIDNKTANYTLVLGDEGKLITVTSASARTVSLPTAHPIGATVDIAQMGAGSVTLAPGSGATVNATPSAVTRAQYSVVTAIKVTATAWLVVGDLAA